MEVALLETQKHKTYKSLEISTSDHHFQRKQG